MKNKTFTQGIKAFTTSILMKYFTLTFAFGLICSTSFALPPLASKQQIGMFLNSKTCVVLENSDMLYNAIIKDAVLKHWKLTEYEFIDQKEFNIRRFDSKYSFLVLMKSVFDKDPGGISYNYVNLVLGDPANDMSDMPELCSIPLSYTDQDNGDYEYVIPAVVKFLQKHAKNLEDHRFMISLQGMKYYNFTANFKDKVLLMNKEMMASEVNSPEKIKTVYPYAIRLLTPLEIQTELAKNPTGTLFNFHVGPTESAAAGKCFEMIFDTEGNLYYYNSRKVTNDNKDGFNRNDFSHIR